MANTTTISSGTHATGGRSFLGGLVARIKHFFEYRSAVNELHNMDDHLLQDIGISRGEIEYFAKGGVRRQRK